MNISLTAAYDSSGSAQVPRDRKFMKKTGQMRTKMTVINLYRTEIWRMGESVLG